MNKALKKTITQQLAKLEELIKAVGQWENSPADSEDWDYDYFSDLLSKLEETIELLKSPEGLLENLEEWQTEQEEEY